MKITCDTCGSHYKIADEKVRGRRVKVKCKSCGKTLVVDGANEAAAAAPASASASAAGGAADTWSVNLGEADQRSMTTNEIADGLRAGWISSEAYVWREGMADWLPLSQVPELHDAIGPSSQRPESAPPAAPAAAAQVAVAQAAFPAPGNGSTAAAAMPKAAARANIKRAGGDLFGQAAAAGSEEEASRDAPLMAGTQPYDDPRPTGARNENSVLFSLDALKVGFGAPAPAGSAAPAPAAPMKGRPPPRKQVASNPDDPFGMGGSDSLAGIGGASFGLGANQALLTAPAPPEPKPIFKLSADPVIGDAGALAPLPSRKSRKALIFGAVIAALVVVGVVIASSGGEKQEVAEASPASTELKASQKPAEKPPEPKKEEPKPEEKADDQKPESKGATATNAKRPAESAKAKSEASEKVAAKTQEDKPQVKQQVSDGVSTFNKGAAIAALSSSAAAASSCKRPGGPTGSGRALVTFAPSGRVTSASITGGDFGGTSVGSCIATVFRRASVPPFSGSPVTVSKSFSISQ